MKNKQEEYWSDYWRTDGQGGEVFVNSKGEKPDYIRDFWRAQLECMPANGRIADLACGAGSIFEDIESSIRSRVTLIAADISKPALDIVKARVPEAQLVCCGCDELPFEKESLDMVVSQFGIEYASEKAFSEAASAITSGGRLVLLSHYKGGYIDQRNAKFLEGAELAISSQFIESASKLVEVLFSGSASGIRQAKENFKCAEKPLSTLIKTNPHGVHNHLYFGFRQLYLRRANYFESDIQSWLSQMKQDIKKSIVKVTEIRKVSLSSLDIDNITRNLEGAGMSEIEIGTLTIPNSDNIVAWTISALKS